MYKVFTKKYRLIWLLIILTEIFSYAGWWWPKVNVAGFIIICLTTLWLSLKDLRYGLTLVLVELIIGSMGRLFWLDPGGLNVSIRMALWLIVISVWLTKGALTIFNLSGVKKKWQEILQLPYGAYFYGLVICLLLGLILGYYNNNQANNVFFDFNNWLYLTLIFPLAASFKQKKDWQLLIPSLIIATAWLAFKTLILLYFFSHNLFWANPEIYQWLRDSGIGEITTMQSGFYRLFFQSHIFVLVAVCWLLALLLKNLQNKNENKNFWLIICALTIGLAVVLAGMSRSFWLGLAGSGLIFIILMLWQKIGFKILTKFFAYSLLSLLSAIVLIVVLVKFPYPTPNLSGDAWDIFNERTQSNEAVSSRWNLLPKLWESISQAPILGKGFGTTIFYKTDDPRIREQSVDGFYETYAFEWGWLDLWLKLGIVGVAVYLWLLLKLVIDSLEKKQIGLVLILTCLIIVNMFTPYLNHPLGLGVIMLTALWLDTSKQKP